MVFFIGLRRGGYPHVITRLAKGHEDFQMGLLVLADEFYGIQKLLKIRRVGDIGRP